MTVRTTKRTNARNRRAMDPSVPKKLTPAVVSSVASTAADTIQITFSTRVLANKLPGFTAGAGGGQTVGSISQVSDTVVELAFTGEVQGTDLAIAGDDPGIRTPSGGFMPAGTYAIPSFPS